MLNIECVLGTFGLTELKNGEVKREERDIRHVLRVALRWNLRILCRN